MNALKESLALGIRTLASRRIYLMMLVVLPMACAWFFLDLLNPGLPLPVPVAVVDMDQSPLSRQVVRNLGAGQYLDITARADNFHEAMDMVGRGDAFGFFYIPRDFQKDSEGGRTATVSFYSDMSIFVPGTMAFRGFKTTAVTTKAGMVLTLMESVGVGPREAMPQLQPVAVSAHPLANPWLNYSIYLSNSFAPGMLALLVMLTTVFSICQEIKQGTAPQWLAAGGGSVLVALTGKLLPQTVVFTLVGWAIQAMLYGWFSFPLNSPLWVMLLAMALLVVATQAFAVIVVEAVPNLRLALSVCALIGILALSVAGFSFPVEQMYGGVGILSYILPIRYYFLIYIDQALNGIPLFYSRWWFIALLLFPLAALPGLRRLGRRLQNPVYVP